MSPIAKYPRGSAATFGAIGSAIVSNWNDIIDILCSIICRG